MFQLTGTYNKDQVENASAAMTTTKNMELTRAVSHLALANQQLAEAYSLTLGHLSRLLTHQPAINSSDLINKTSGSRGLFFNLQ